MSDTLSLVRIGDKTLAAFLPINLNPCGTERDRMSGTDGNTRFALITKLGPEDGAHQ